MKNNLIRLSSSLFAAFLFVFILLSFPDAVSNEPVADIVKQTLKVSVRISEKEAPVVYSEETETISVMDPEEEHVVFLETNEEVSEVISETETISVMDPEEEHEVFLETNEEVSEVISETETFISSYLDADSATDNLTLPVIDLKRVYSKIVYPASLRRKNIEAEIELRVYVDKDGNINLQFPDGTENAFINSIEKAFKGIKAKPAIYKGNPADVTFTIPIHFKLK